MLVQDVGLKELHYGEGLEAELGGNWYLKETQNTKEKK